MRKPRPEAIKRAQLGDAIIEHVAHGPKSTAELAEHFGVNAKTLYNLLRDLRNDRELHQVRSPIPRIGGITFVWALGPNPNEANIADRSAQVPSRVVVKTWDLHNVRDSLVAALFGPAGEACHG